MSGVESVVVRLGVPTEVRGDDDENGELGEVATPIPIDAFPGSSIHINLQPTILLLVVVGTSAILTTASWMQQQRRQGRKAFEFSSPSVGVCPVYWLIDDILQSLHHKDAIYKTQNTPT